MAKMQTKEEAGLTRMNESGLVDIAEMRRLESEGFLNCNVHRTSDLLTWNYTAKAQWEKMWTKEVLMSRGLITRPDGTIVARPFVKFHNFEEHHGPLPDGPYEVWEKVDGSLGILYVDDQGEWQIATRGSFHSDQAVMATQMLREQRYATHLEVLDRDFTHLFEIIYPENRIVVDYGEKRGLVYLGAVHTEKGWDLMPERASWPDVAEFFSTMATTDNPLDLKLLEAPNKEGFVLRFTGSGLRLKVKFDEYVRLHKMVTDLTARGVWEMIRYQGEEELWRAMDNVPDEYYAWTKTIAAGLIERYERHLDDAAASLREGLTTVGHGDRGALVRWLKANSSEFDLAMGKLDGKDYSTVGSKSRDRLWRRVRPRAVKPFGALEMFEGEGDEDEPEA